MNAVLSFDRTSNAPPKVNSVDENCVADPVTEMTQFRAVLAFTIRSENIATQKMAVMQITTVVTVFFIFYHFEFL